MDNNKIQRPKPANFIFDKNFPLNYKAQQIRSAKNLNISLGANETPSSLNIYSHHHQNQYYQNDNNKIPFYHKQELSSKIKPQQQSIQKNQWCLKLNSMVKQNQKLKQENQLLKKQLTKIKKQSYFNGNVNNKDKQKLKINSREHSKQHSGDLRGTIKKEFQEMIDVKQIKIKFEILSKQCKTYEEMIQNLQHTIKKLTQQNKLLNSSSYHHFSHKHQSQHQHNYSKLNKQDQFEKLKEKINMIMKEYSELQSKMHSQQLQWVIWKEQWLTEKNIYLNKIKQLEQKLKDNNRQS